MIELSRAQDEEVGDGTTSVIILSESTTVTHQLWQAIRDASLILSISLSFSLSFFSVSPYSPSLSLSLSLSLSILLSYSIPSSLSISITLAISPLSDFSSLLGGEILAMAEPLLNRNFHPTVIVSGYCKALQKALEVCKAISRVIDVDNIKVPSRNLVFFCCCQVIMHITYMTWKQKYLNSSFQYFSNDLSSSIPQPPEFLSALFHFYRFHVSTFLE